MSNQNLKWTSAKHHGLSLECKFCKKPTFREGQRLLNLVYVYVIVLYPICQSSIPHVFLLLPSKSMKNGETSLEHFGFYFWATFFALSCCFPPIFLSWMQHPAVNSRTIKHFNVYSLFFNTTHYVRPFWHVFVSHFRHIGTPLSV